MRALDRAVQENGMSFGIWMFYDRLLNEMISYNQFITVTVTVTKFQQYQTLAIILALRFSITKCYLD